MNAPYEMRLETRAGATVPAGYVPVSTVNGMTDHRKTTEHGEYAPLSLVACALNENDKAAGVRRLFYVHPVQQKAA